MKPVSLLSVHGDVQQSVSDVFIHLKEGHAALSWNGQIQCQWCTDKATLCVLLQLLSLVA